MNREVNSGVSMNSDGKFEFDWKTDNLDTDILHLCKDTSGVKTANGVTYVYGYKYNLRADPNEVRTFRRILKNMANSDNAYISENVYDFIEDGIFRLNKYERLENFKVSIFVKSTSEESPLFGMMDNIFAEYLRNREFDLHLVKQMYRDVQFDMEKAREAMVKSGLYKNFNVLESRLARAVQQLERFKSSGELFQMKKFSPRPLREGFYNFLKFANEEQEELYRSIQGVDVLIYDDFITSGSTIREIVWILHSVNPDNRLTAFALIEQ